jgi:large subunit ribosomal protein L25
MTISSSSGDITEAYPVLEGHKTGLRYHPLPLMAASTDTSTTLALTSRTAEGSRSARRLRRTGQVPGVIYGGGDEPELFAVDGRILRNTLAHSGAILEVAVDGGATAPVLVKDVQRHPVRGHAVHVDLLRVDMKVAIQTHVTLELLGADEAPGVVEGGVLSQGVVEINIEALPGDIPDSIQFDVSGLQMNEVATLAQLEAPEGVTLLDDPDETVLASVMPPTKEPEPEEIETETELVGEGEEGEAAEAAEAQADGDTGEEAEQSASSDES